ncbi:MAG: hypothetical protein H6592_03030 [Flavobacteriales bacterium]|nr:hypothetical protein [Flavobacteriales bacterium]
MLGIGPWCAMHGQEFSCSIAARCSLPLNDPAQLSYHLDLGYADTSWTIDWLRIDYAAAYLFKTIDDFTLEEQTRSVGLAFGWYMHRRERLEMRVGIQLRYNRIERSVFTGPSGWAYGSYTAQCMGSEVPVQIALRLGRSSPFHFFVEAVPGYSHVLSQRSFDRPDTSMRVRNTLSMALLSGFRLRI